jgi:hypothetical protein
MPATYAGIPMHLAVPNYRRLPTILAERHCNYSPTLNRHTQGLATPLPRSPQPPI